MSIGVNQYLNDTGGNFTELSARPPVPGEETERQSNGGNSTRSSGSHKSHLSTSSAKSGGDKSPSVTPRRSNLDRSGAPPIGSNLLKGDCDAPLGFEPEGSAANTPPFTENGTPPLSGTPPYLKWAENLNFLLEDSDGVKLYKQFLDEMQCSEILDFWFACRGLKLLDSKAEKRISELSRVIYKRFIRADKLNLGSSFTKPIAECLKSGKVNQTIFDHAQAKVELSMRENTYPDFLGSMLYLHYVQAGGESPKSGNLSNSNVSSGSSSVRPISRTLPTLNEDQELKHEDLNDSMKEMPPPPIPQASLNQSIGSQKSRKSHHAHKVECPAPHYYPRESSSSLYHHEASRGSKHSYPSHNSYVTVSAQDSEAQSLSSDAHTDTDTLSMTDTSSIDGRDRHGHIINVLPNKRYRTFRMKKNAKQNRHTELNTHIIPRTEHAPKNGNIAEVDPGKFHEMVTEKLEAYLAEKQKMYIIKSLDLQEPVDVDQSISHITHNLSSLGTSMTSSLNPAINPSMNASMNATHPFPGASDSFVFMNRSGFHANTADTTTASLDPDDSAQSILDAHVSTVWDSSTGQTPSRSPGRHSPDRIAPAHVDKSRSCLANTSNLSGPFNTSSSSKYHHSSKRNRDKDTSLSNTSATVYTVDPPEKIQQYYKQHAQYHHYRSSSSAEPTSADYLHTTGNSGRRGIHHPSSSEVPPPVPLRGSTLGHHWDDREFPSSSARGRTREQRRSSAATKKATESNSNIESGVGLPGGLPDLLPPGSTGPQSQRVMEWMLENEKIAGSSYGAGGSTDNSERSSSHKRSTHKSMQSPSQHRQSKKSGQHSSNSRSGSLDRSLLGMSGTGMNVNPMQNLSGYSNQGSNAPAPGGPDCNYNMMQAPGSYLPSQPIAQDPRMPILPAPNTAAQLEEAKRRLEDNKFGSKMKQSRSFTGQSSKDRKNMPPPLMPRANPNKSTIVPGAPSPNINLSLTDDRDKFKKPLSVPATPVGQQLPLGNEMVVIYYLGDEKIPYRTTLPGRPVTLASFKTKFGSRGNYKFYFKKPTEEFEVGAFMEEISQDDAVLPIFEGKIYGKVQRIE